MLVERHAVKTTKEMIRLCSLSKELQNRCNYFMRTAWFARKRLPDINILYRKTRELDCFRGFNHTRTPTQTIRQVLIDWSNFRKALIAWKKDSSKFVSMPKPPGYKKKLAPVIFNTGTIRKKPLRDGIITPTNDLFIIKSTKKFRQVVLIPKTFGFIVEVQYDEKDQETQVKKESGNGVMAVDLGLNRLCAITSDRLEAPILINGRVVKAINQWYNKRPCKKRSKKRYWRLENIFHHVSARIVDMAADLGVGRIIVGRNVGWKRKINLGRKTNQAFSYVAFDSLLRKIRYKALRLGIEVVVTEEAYTSKASFLDRDPIPPYVPGVKVAGFSGTRIKRGLYRTKDGLLVNADVNGSANICRKVIRNEQVLLRLDRSLAARPSVLDPLKPARLDKRVEVQAKIG